MDFFTFQLIYFWKIKKLISDCDFIIPIYTPLIIPAIWAKKQKKLKAKIVLLYQDCIEMLWVGPYIKFILSRSRIQKYISGVIAVSHPIARQYRKITSKNAKVITNGIEHEIFFDRKLAKKNYLLFVGRLNKPKGFPIFLKAFQKVKERFPEIQAKAVSPNIKNKNSLQLIRYQNRQQLAKIYNQAKIFVNPSFGESFGLTSLEAMATKTAVILTNTIGSQEYAQNKKNCLIVPIDNEQKLVQAIIKLIIDKKLRKKLEIAGPRTVKKYNWKNSTKKFLNYLKSLK